MTDSIKKYPSLKNLPITPYSLELPLERLTLGVDNLRYDVHISPQFAQTAAEFIFQLILKHADASKPLQSNPKLNWFQKIAQFKNACTELMTDAINKAKSRQEEQIDYLAQIALVKKLQEEIGHQYEAAVQHFKNVIRKQEVSHRMEAHHRLREEVSGIIQRRNSVLRDVSTELFDYFIEARRELNELRAINFGEENLLPEELFANPLLQTPNRPDDFFMISNYVLLGYRLEDPLNYNALLPAIRSFFSGMDIDLPTRQRTPEKQIAILDGKQFVPVPAHQETAMDRLIKRVENIDILFNCFDTENRLRREKRHKGEKDKIKSLKTFSRVQKQMLRMLYKEMKREKLLDGIVAAYEVPRIIETYCPPLSPQEVLQYLVVPKARKGVLRKIKRFKNYTGKQMPLARLKRASRLARIPRQQKQMRLIRFLKDFAAYHRDMGNNHLFRETADCINLAEEEKIVKLSRENNTLYEFMFSREHVADKQNIINHVVIKADVRGSTEIIEQMKSKGLNPASNFSLNFFDPITNLLPQYGAQKVFIEGDAVILSILEHEGMPERWYGVARACGLSINMLLLVKRYNQRNQKNLLPRLDLGIGVSYSNGAPTFFYDGNTQIMISHSINEADILSGCDKALRKRFEDADLPFNLYVYQIDTAQLEARELFNKPVLRYNVMGIELAPEAFEKLADEIHLKRFEGQVPGMGEEPFVGYTGKFPTLSGSYQRIVIREAEIPEISPKDFSTLRMTGKKYYEVCTSAKIYEYVKSLK